jgi:hypothetical protein
VPAKPLSSAQLMSGPPIRELIMLAGKDGTGKSCAIVSTAYYVGLTNPDATFYVIDTENKFRSALKSFGADMPTNIRYYKTTTMNEVTDATAEILAQHKPGDWLGVESMGRVWERAQDMGYNVIKGMGKAAYMEERREKIKAGGSQKDNPVTPKPDELWSIVKGAHDGAFVDLLTQTDDLNVIMSSPIARPPKPDAFIKENQDRKTVRIELGIDMGIEGAPRLPYYVETLCLLDVRAGQVSCRILRDNLSTIDPSRIEFDVPDRKSWAVEFWGQCRQ